MAKKSKVVYKGISQSYISVTIPQVSVGAPPAIYTKNDFIKVNGIKAF